MQSENQGDHKLEQKFRHELGERVIRGLTEGLKQNQNWGMHLLPVFQVTKEADNAAYDADAIMRMVTPSSMFKGNKSSCGRQLHDEDEKHEGGYLGAILMHLLNERPYAFLVPVLKALLEGKQALPLYGLRANEKLSSDAKKKNKQHTHISGVVEFPKIVNAPGLTDAMTSAQSYLGMVTGLHKNLQKLQSPSADQKQRAEPVFDGSQFNDFLVHIQDTRDTTSAVSAVGIYVPNAFKEKLEDWKLLLENLEGADQQKSEIMKQILKELQDNFTKFGIYGDKPKEADAKPSLEKQMLTGLGVPFAVPLVCYALMMQSYKELADNKEEDPHKKVVLPVLLNGNLYNVKLVSPEIKDLAKIWNSSPEFRAYLAPKTPAEFVYYKELVAALSAYKEKNPNDPQYSLPKLPRQFTVSGLFPDPQEIRVCDRAQLFLAQIKIAADLLELDLDEKLKSGEFEEQFGFDVEPLVCQTNYTLMQNPYLSPYSGYSHDIKAIEQLREDPTNRQPLSQEQWVPNRLLQELTLALLRVAIVKTEHRQDNQAEKEISLETCKQIIREVIESHCGISMDSKFTPVIVTQDFKANGQSFEKGKTYNLATVAAALGHQNDVEAFLQKENLKSLSEKQIVRNQAVAEFLKTNPDLLLASEQAPAAPVVADSKLAGEADPPTLLAGQFSGAASAGNEWGDSKRRAAAAPSPSSNSIFNSAHRSLLTAQEGVSELAASSQSSIAGYPAAFLGGGAPAPVGEGSEDSDDERHINDI